MVLLFIGITLESKMATKYNLLNLGGAAVISALLPLTAQSCKHSGPSCPSQVSQSELEGLITNVFAPKGGERVTLLNDFPSDPSKVDDNYLCRKEMVEQWKKTFEKVGAERKFTVEGIITYEPTGKNGALLPELAQQAGHTLNLTKRLDSLDEKDIVVAITRYSATGPLDFRLEKGGQNFRGTSMPGAHMNMSAFKADYSLVASKARVLAQKLTEAEGAEVIFSTGDKMYFDLRGREGDPDDGYCQQPKKLINLPSGEAYVAPYEGKDESMGKSQTHGRIPVKYGKEMVVYHVENNRIVKVLGNGAKAKEMETFFAEDPTRGNIAELGLGCNDKAEPIAEILQNEKIEGMHWAYGSNNHFKGGMVGPDDYRKKENSLHEDIIYGNLMPIGIKSIQLNYTDGKKEMIMMGGKYLF